ncbi:MAG: hypothetical protein QNK36_11655, partial [Colwellia sp.]|nr:hypothetical protein [Colwellia sp.]
MQLYFKKPTKKWQEHDVILKNIPLITNISAKFIAVVLFMVHINSNAIETSIQVHKVDQSGTYGFSLGVGDNFFDQRELNWAVSYNRLTDVNITWNNDDINFDLDTVDLMLSYRYYPHSYNRFVKGLIVEFQVGAGAVLTENKFLWPAISENEEKYFSEQGDINSVFGFMVHKKFTKQVAMHIGLKRYPDYSEFGDVSSVFLGFTYIFGRQTA